MTLVLRQHQNEAIDFAARRGRALLWHEVGLGKTLSALNAAKKVVEELRLKGVKNPKILIVLPKSLTPQWRAEVALHCSEVQPYLLFTTYTQLHNVRHLINFYDVRCVMFDESHYLKTLGTQRIGRVIQVLQCLAESKYGFKDGRIFLLTATPMPNHAGELYTTWCLCSSDDLNENIKRLEDRGRYMEWLKLFTNRKLKKIPGRKRMGYAPPEGVHNEDKLFKLMENFIHFRAAADCLDLPDSRELTIDLGLADDALLANASIERPDQYMALVERLNRSKTPFALEWIKDFIEHNPDKHLIVFSPYTTILNELYGSLKGKAEIITGQVNVSDRDKARTRFKDREVQVLLLSYGAGALGLNLQFAYNTLYLGYPWSPKIITQAKGRTDRSGQVNKTVHTFLLSGENDRRVLGLLRNKEAAIDMLEDHMRVSDLKEIGRRTEIDDIVDSFI